MVYCSDSGSSPSEEENLQDLVQPKKGNAVAIVETI